jgi:thiol-disulfide isomerase/thioredoxin
MNRPCGVRRAWAAIGVWSLLAVGVVASVGVVSGTWPLGRRVSAEDQGRVVLTSYQQGGRASLRGGFGWINSGPITLEELRGKVVLLDFWTFCCINCHHILPDLAKLEEKYPNELVVIGVHSAKFPAERDTDNIRRKVREYRIKHPVINDADRAIWTRFGVDVWPTLVLIDVNGNVVDGVTGEGKYDYLDRKIGQLIEAARDRGELNTTPFKFTPEIERQSDTPLLFPGKICADVAGNRLFISDTGHNRIVQTDLEGRNPVVIGNGNEGLVDGDYEKARFNRPQGVFVSKDTLYVADTESHAIRAVDLKAHEVSTIAGTGVQAPYSPNTPEPGPGRGMVISSPWDITQIPGDNTLFIAMAGPHQIWRYDPGSGVIGRFAGTGDENIFDGTVLNAKFAQPSGITTDGTNLFVADSEVSGIREITPSRGQYGPRVNTIAGQGLFAFGDHDGRGASVRLQHCLGVGYGDGKLFIADSYNNKIKVCDLKTRSIRTLVGNHAAGDSDKPPHFYEPGGLSVAGPILYVADTNNHKVRMVNLATDAVKTLPLEGLTPPRAVRRPPSFPNATKTRAPKFLAKPGKALSLAVAVEMPRGYKLNEEQALHYLVETPEQAGALGAEVSPEGGRVKPPAKSFTIPAPLANDATAGQMLTLRFSLSVFVCSEVSSLCRIQSFVWEIPVEFSDSGTSDAIKLDAVVK